MSTQHRFPTALLEPTGSGAALPCAYEASHYWRLWTILTREVEDKIRAAFATSARVVSFCPHNCYPSWRPLSSPFTASLPGGAQHALLPCSRAYLRVDLTLDARLLYASNSIGDILGYRPEDVVGRSCWEYFHPDEIPFAQAVHGRGIQLDKAAVLNYCQIKNRAGQWIGCECVFTVVHDVLVGCTSIYRRGIKSQSKLSSIAP